METKILKEAPLIDTLEDTNHVPVIDNEDSGKVKRISGDNLNKSILGNRTIGGTAPTDIVTNSGLQTVSGKRLKNCIIVNEAEEEVMSLEEMADSVSKATKNKITATLTQNEPLQDMATILDNNGYYSKDHCVYINDMYLEQAYTYTSQDGWLSALNNILQPTVDGDRVVSQIEVKNANTYEELIVTVSFFVSELPEGK